jgi:hypothetical protein
MDFFIYRNNEFIEKLAPSEIKLTRSLSGVFFLTFKTQQNIQQNDVLKTKINDTDFTFNIVKEKDSYKAYHRIYDLSKKLFLREIDGADQFGIIGYEANKTALESYLTGFGFNLIDNLDASLKDNLKAVDYSSDNVLSALTKFLEAFGAEHEFNDYNIYIKTRVGLDIPQQFIQAGGNTNAITKEIDTSNIITRLYPKGKSDNLDVLENYYYNELRPVNYDFVNKKIEDNPVLYIDSSVIEQYGVIEQIKEFDVKLHNLNGSVVSWGQITIDEENYNYIDIDKTIDLSILEANQCTLFMTKGFEQVQEVRIKYNSCTTTRIVYYPQLTNKDIYDIDFTGGTYILMAYITQTQYDEAKNQLITEANNYLEQHKEAKITYSINFAYFSEQDRQQINLSVNIGDAVRLIDKSQAIDTDVRVLDFEYDLKLGMYNKITFSNTFERMPVNSIIDEMYVKLLEQQKKIREEALLLNGSVQTARTALERHELLVQKQFYGSENEYVRIGSEDRNYQVHGLEIVPTLERIDWTEFRFQEVAEDISYKVSAGNKIETTTKDYFMSIRIDKNDTENLNNGNIISFNAEMEKGEIGGYTYYPLGVVRFVAGKVAIPAIDKGFTLIHGDFIQTGTIEATQLVKTLELVAEQKITIPDTIALGYNALSDSTAGLKISNGKVEIQGQSSKLLLSSQGIRQIYTISMADQIDSSYSLSIPIYIPKNADGTDVSSGIARIIVKTEKFRAYSKTVGGGGGTTLSSSSGGGTTTTSNAGGSWSGQTSATFSGTSLHSHSVVISSHNHEITLDGHTHSVTIPPHTHPIDFGIYESANTATITVSKGTSSWAVTTGNKLDVSNIAISDGETINISANNLARVQAYIFVEYFLY